MEVVSRTAVWVAVARAIGAREPDFDVRNPDWLAERLLGDMSQYDVDLPIIAALDEDYEVAMKDPEVAGMVRTMNVRSRFIDDALEHAIRHGITQVLILGTGFDSHACRFEEQLRHARIFEVDRPATLAKKRERVEKAVGRVPDNVVYVDADVEASELRSVLTAVGYDFGQRSFVIMEGLTMYLHEDALRDLFSLLTAHAPGSRIVFDFITDVMVASIRNINIDEVPEVGRAYIRRFLHLIRDEPFQFGFPVGRERESIESFGLDIHDLIMLDGEDAVRRYLTRADGTQVGEEGLANRPPIPAEIERRQREVMTYRICEAVVPQRH